MQEKLEIIILQGAPILQQLRGITDEAFFLAWKYDTTSGNYIHYETGK